MSDRSLVYIVGLACWLRAQFHNLSVLNGHIPVLKWRRRLSHEHSQLGTAGGA